MKIKADKKKLYSYHINTLDGLGDFNFFTMAENHKEALKKLQSNSIDFIRLVKANKDLTITIKKL